MHVELSARIICMLWSKCVSLDYVLKDCGTAIMVPVFNKRDKAEPESCRPIAFVSHVRNIIELAVARAIRRQY